MLIIYNKVENVKYKHFLLVDSDIWSPFYTYSLKANAGFSIFFKWLPGKITTKATTEEIILLSDACVHSDCLDSHIKCLL